MSTKTKGHTSSKSSSIFPPKDDISIDSNSIGALKKVKKGKSIKKLRNGDSSKNVNILNQGMAKNKKSNLKIFSLLDPGALMTNPSACGKEPKISDATVKSNSNANSCNSSNYFKIMAATKSYKETDVLDDEKYQEDCESEKERLRGFRKWSNTTVGQKFKQKYAHSSLFTILSYNILAQNLLESHSYLYRKHDARALTWSHRIQKILAEIICHDAEIICLQEVQEDHIAYLTKTLMPLNYEYVYKKRTLNHSDGSAIFYKTNVFKMLEYKLVEYYRPNNEILNRGNVGIVLKLKLKDAQSNNCTNTTDSDIVVATTHLLYNPRRNDVRLAQAQLMLAELDKMAYVGLDKNGLIQYLPVILTGDFNLQPHTAVYELMTKGVLQYFNLSYRFLEPMVNKKDSPQGYELLPDEIGVTDNCQYKDVVLKRAQMCTNSPQTSSALNQRTKSGFLLHSFNFTSSYSHLTNQKAQASTYQNKWITVDYIFYSRGSNSTCGETGQLNLLSRLELPTIPECDFMGQIPNLVFGSDHLLLAAKFLFQR